MYILISIVSQLGYILIHTAGLIATVYFIETNTVYFAGGVFFATLVVSEYIRGKLDSHYYPAAALTFVAGLIIFLYLLHREQPYWAGIILGLSIISIYRETGDEGHYTRVAFPYTAAASVFISGLAVSAHLIQYNHPYWAGGVLLLLASHVVGGYTRLENIEQTLYPARLLFLTGGIAASAYLFIENHSYWAVGLILLTLLLMSMAGTKR